MAKINRAIDLNPIPFTDGAFIYVTQAGGLNLGEPVAAPSYRYAKINVNGGDKFTLNNAASVSAGMYAFYDENGRRITGNEDALVYSNQEIVAPGNAAWLVINDYNKNYDCYYGLTAQTHFDDIASATEKQNKYNGAYQKKELTLNNGVVLSNGNITSSGNYYYSADEDEYYREDALGEATKYSSYEEAEADLLKAKRKADGLEPKIVKASLTRKSLNSEQKIASARREAALAKIEAKREVRKAQMLASRNEARLMEMHDAEERQRLFQSSQSAINEEKIAIKQGMSRNSSTLDKLYGNMF
jgi:hypothetical protein